MEKTNVMRILDHNKIPYTPYTYEPSVTDGVSVAQAVGKQTECVFKTLVTVANTGEHYVFVIPVADTLHLKKAARAVSVKAVAMLRQKELLPLTGYVHGGCSPVGMKKPFVTVLDETAQLLDAVVVSAGRVGYQVELDPARLAELIGASFADVTGEEVPG